MIAWFLVGMVLLAVASYCGWNAIRSAREQHSRNTSFWIVASLLTTLLSFGIFTHGLLGGPWSTVSFTYSEPVTRTVTETVMEPKKTTSWLFFTKTEEKPVERPKEVIKLEPRTESRQVFSAWYLVWQMTGMILAACLVFLVIVWRWRRFG